MEFFHESKCLLYYRLEPKTTQVKDYIQNTCHCQHDNNNNASITDVHITHDAHGGGRRSSSSTMLLDLLSQETDLLAAVDALTRVDQKLYQVALEQFMREMIWLESSLGRRVLCDHVLHQWEPQLAYLNVSVTSVYNIEKRNAAVVTTSTNAE
jgi:hypothetical protein